MYYHFTTNKFSEEGTDRLCKVVKLSMQLTHKNVSTMKITESEVMKLGGYVFRKGFFKSLNNDDKK